MITWQIFFLMKKISQKLTILLLAMDVPLSHIFYLTYFLLNIGLKKTLPKINNS